MALRGVVWKNYYLEIKMMEDLACSVVIGIIVAFQQIIVQVLIIVTIAANFILDFYEKII